MFPRELQTPLLAFAVASGLLAVSSASRAEPADSPAAETPPIATVLVSRHARFTPQRRGLELEATLEKGETVLISRSTDTAMVYVKSVSHPENQGWTEMAGLDLMQIAYSHDVREFFKDQRVVVADKEDLEAAEPEDVPTTLEPGSLVEITGAPLTRSMTLRQYPVKVIAIPGITAGVTPVGTRGWIDPKTFRYIPVLQPQPVSPDDGVASTPEEEKNRRALLSKRKEALQTQYQNNLNAAQSAHKRQIDDLHAKREKEQGDRRAAYRIATNALQTKYNQDVEAVRTRYNQSSGDLKTKYNNESTNLRLAYNGASEDRKTTYNTDLIALKTAYFQSQADLKAKKQPTDTIDVSFAKDKKALDDKFGSDRAGILDPYLEKKKLLDDRYEKDSDALIKSFVSEKGRLDAQNVTDNDALQAPFDQDSKEISDRYDQAEKALEQPYQQEMAASAARHQKEIGSLENLIQRSSLAETAMLDQRAKTKQTR